MAELFEVVATNPNDAVGGGGCLCSESRDVDCKGPYAVFYAQEMASNASPHAVLSIDCAQAFLDQAAKEVIAGGEADPNTEDVPSI
jgi:hypothetical protein